MDSTASKTKGTAGFSKPRDTGRNTALCWSGAAPRHLEQVWSRGRMAQFPRWARNSRTNSPTARCLSHEGIGDTMSMLEPFFLTGPDGKRVRGDCAAGKDRQILFITGFLSKRWGNKSKALAQWCQERGWGFCCFDFRGWGDSEGRWGEYRLLQWLEDAESVASLLADGPPVTIVGNSLGGWLAWLVAQQQQIAEELILIAPAFNLMGLRAAEIPS